MNEAWEHQKKLKRLSQHRYTYIEVLNIVEMMIADATQRYNDFYAITSANVLNAEPFKFGKKRIELFNKLIHDNVVGLRDGTIDIDMVLDTAKKLGIVTKDAKQEGL